MFGYNRASNTYTFSFILVIAAMDVGRPLMIPMELNIRRDNLLAILPKLSKQYTIR